jgi:hypothetical protein
MENFNHVNDIYHVFPSFTGLAPIVLNVWIHRRGKTTYDAVFVYNGKIVATTTEKSKIDVNKFGQKLIEKEITNGFIDSKSKVI